MLRIFITKSGPGVRNVYAETRITQIQFKGISKVFIPIVTILDGGS